MNLPSPIASNPSPGLLVLLTVPHGAARTEAIDAILRQKAKLRPAAIMVEGLAGPGNSTQDGVFWHLLPPGCPCCIGQLPLLVTLTRLIRAERPNLVILALAPGAHLTELERLLRERFGEMFRYEHFCCDSS